MDVFLFTGYVVETVSATDEDPSNTPNGQIEYRIVSGSQDKFTIDGSSGTVTVAEGATFDRETRPVYNIEVGYPCTHTRTLKAVSFKYL